MSASRPAKYSPQLIGVGSDGDRIRVRWFDDIRLKDVPAVGGKTASLGELHVLLTGRVPDGFALTAEAYRAALAAAGVENELLRPSSGFDHHDVVMPRRARRYGSTAGV